MVKIFELDPASDIWVILDLDRDVHVGEGDDSTEEYGVRIAASVARYFLTANRSVGFMTFGRNFDVIEADRGVQQYTRILESLAMARAWGDVPLGNLLSNEARRFGRHTTVVVDHALDGRELGGGARHAAAARREGRGDPARAEHVRRRRERARASSRRSRRTTCSRTSSSAPTTCSRRSRAGAHVLT